MGNRTNWEHQTEPFSDRQGISIATIVVPLVGIIAGCIAFLGFGFSFITSLGIGFVVFVLAALISMRLSEHVNTRL